MKLRHLTIGLLAFAAGCDTMDRDTDGPALSIDNQSAYFFPGNDGFIDLASRVISPGKVRVEITSATRHGVLTDLGKGLLQYSPNGNKDDSFAFRVFDGNNKVIGQDSIGIVIPKDTTHLPCNYIFTRNDSIKNVTGVVIADVTSNDYSCAGGLLVSINTAPLFGTAVVIGNKIQYTPGSSFNGFDRIIYKASVGSTSVPIALGMLSIYGPSNSTSCTVLAMDDLYYIAKSDTSVNFLNIFANDRICTEIDTISLIQKPKYGYPEFYVAAKVMTYRPYPGVAHDDTLHYKLLDKNGSYANARVIIKRN